VDRWTVCHCNCHCRCHCRCTCCCCFHFPCHCHLPCRCCFSCRCLCHCCCLCRCSWCYRRSRGIHCRYLMGGSWHGKCGWCRHQCNGQGDSLSWPGLSRSPSLALVMFCIGIRQLFIGPHCLDDTHLSSPAGSPWDVLHLIVGSPVVQDNGLCTVLQPKVAFEVVQPACERPQSGSHV
jgi:hypothetical protein